MAAALAVAVLVGGCANDPRDSGEASNPPSTTALATVPTTVTTTTTLPDEEHADGVVPGAEWAVVTPADHDLDPAELEKARDYAFQDSKYTQGVVVIRGGEIVAEWYADGAGADSWAASWSMAKSFTSATVGIAIDEGLIDSVDSLMADHLPSWRGTDHADVTVRDVLRMQSGLTWDEDYRGSDADIVKMVVGEADQLAFATSRPQGVPPGTRWNYSSGDTMLLGGVVEAATGTTLAAYATEHLLDPIGMSRVEWWSDAAGHTLGYCCFDTTSRDFARLGLLYLHHGRWGDEQVVPEAWVAASVEPAPNTGGEYGYQWWTEDLDGIPSDTYWAEGIDGQFIYVLPSLDMVVVRNSTYVKYDGPPVADPNLFPKYPSGGLVPGKGTSEPDDWQSAQFLRPIVDAATG